MIIQCQKCRTRFNIDETLIKGAGSKVKCSVCKHVFEAYPPGEVLVEEAHVAAGEREELEKSPESEQMDQEIDFDKLFENTLEDMGRLEAGAAEDFEGPEEEEPDKEELPEKGIPSTDVEAETDKGYPEEAEVTPAISYQERPRRSHFLSVFLVVILLIVGAAGAIVFWTPELIPDSLSILRPAEKREVADVSARLLSFKDVTGAFVDSKKAGHLFVIRGLVGNKYQKSRSFILVKGTILDDRGKVVKQKLAYAGNTYKVEELKVLPMEAINKAMENRFGKGKINLNVAPDSSIPFMIVFGNLPDNLSEFTVEAVSSSPVN